MTNYDYRSLSIDEIMDRLAWIVSRRRYCMACQKRPSGEDATAEHYLLAELGTRLEQKEANK